MKIIIPIHSILDVITNSSSELFVIDTTQSAEAIQNIVDVALIDFPAESEWAFGHKPNVYEGDPSYYENHNFNSYDDDELIDHLQRKGYKIEKPEVVTEPRAIIIEWERGYVSREFIKFIEEMFNVEVISH